MAAFKFTKPEKSFVKYDVANSAFTLMTTAVLPIFFNSLAKSGGVSSSVSTAYWGYTISVSTLILALIYPFLGSIADFKGNKKKIFFIFWVIGLAGNLALSMTNDWLVLLAIYVVANLGYSGTLVFYDAMLTDVTEDSRMDRVSTAGYAWGYIGSCVPFVLGLALILESGKIGLDKSLATRLSFLIIAIWWGLFTIPLLKNVRQRHYKERTEHCAKQAFTSLLKTMKAIGRNRPLLFFMIAFFFYIDGVNTIIGMATKYGTMVGVDDTGMLLALLITQIIAFPFAILAGVFSKKAGTRRMLVIYICMYIAITIFAVFLRHTWQFWVLACSVGVCQGGIQALSRSYFGKLVPKENSNEYFGFYDIFGKYSSVMGASIIGVFSQFNMGSIGVGAISVLFVAGLILLIRVPRTAADLSATGGISPAPENVPAGKV